MSKKTNKRNNPPNNDDSSTDDEEKYDSREYTKFLSKLFPSKYTISRSR